MSPDTAEMAIVDAVEAVPARAPSPQAPFAAARAALLADPARADALRDSWRALWLSRVLVWAAAVGTVATLGYGPVRNAFNPPGVTRGFGSLGDLLAAGAARWDASWYLVIAHLGYRPELGAFTSARDAFFPLYPLALHLLSGAGVQPVLAGVLVSLTALAAALYLLHRLTALELGARPCFGGGEPAHRGEVAHGGEAHGEGAHGGEVARMVVFVTALGPMAFFFSAVYSESLYLALSVGLFWFARQGRWALVGVLGAAAAATRSTGVLLLLPAAILYLYGPREDRLPDRAAAAGSRLLLRLRPRYRMRANILWLCLLPAGLAAYLLYLGLAGGDPLAPFRSQQVWDRHFAGPYVGIWDGLRAALAGARQLLSFQRAHVYFPIAGGSPDIAAGHNLMLIAFLLAAAPLLVGTLRMLPLAYGAYTVAALALPLSYPVAPQPLMSLPRFLMVLFPLSMVLGAWLAAHPRARLPALVASAALMMFFCAQFATWHWVA